MLQKAGSAATPPEDARATAADLLRLTGRAFLWLLGIELLAAIGLRAMLGIGASALALAVLWGLGIWAARAGVFFHIGRRSLAYGRAWWVAVPASVIALAGAQLVMTPLTFLIGSVATIPGTFLIAGTVDRLALSRLELMSPGRAALTAVVAAVAAFQGSRKGPDGDGDRSRAMAVLGGAVAALLVAGLLAAAA